MDEKQLFYISLIGSFVGIIGLMVVSYFYTENITAIQDINEDFIDKNVIILGKFTEVEKKEGLYMLNVQDDTGTIKGVIFSDEDISLEKNREYKMSGLITEYQNSLEITISKIELF